MDTAVATQNIIEAAVETSVCKTLVRALRASGFDKVLQSEGPYTLLAPNDNAFSELSAASLESLMNDREGLREMISYHIIAGSLTAADIAETQSIKTLQGTDVSIASTQDGLKINNATVILSDIECENGIIHIIDSVLMPS